MHIRLGMTAAIAAAAIGASASAAPLLFGGHYYDFVFSDRITWAAADLAASAASLNGQGGYLATITSAAENEFLRASYSTGGGFNGAWLGGFVDAGGAGAWLRGPESGQQFSQGGSPFMGAYSNWGGIEPNNAPSFAYMNIGTHPQIANGAWADAAGGLTSDNDPVSGYFVEFNAVVVDPRAVPEPATWAMMILGFAGLGAMLRRRRSSLA